METELVFDYDRPQPALFRWFMQIDPLSFVFALAASLPLGFIGEAWCQAVIARIELGNWPTSGDPNPYVLAERLGRTLNFVFTYGGWVLLAGCMTVLLGLGFRCFSWWPRKVFLCAANGMTWTLLVASLFIDPMGIYSWWID